MDNLRGRKPPNAEQEALLHRHNELLFRMLNKGKPAPQEQQIEKVTEEVIPGEPDRTERVSPSGSSVSNATDALDEILRRLEEQSKVDVRVAGNDFRRAISALIARSRLRGMSASVQREVKMVEFFGRKLQDAIAAEARAEAEIKRQVATVRTRLSSLRSMV